MRVLAAAALLALAWPAAAHAAAAGGGTAPDSVRGYRDQLTIITVRPKADGTAVVRALVQARCGAGEIKRTVTLAPDGSFAINTTQHDRAPEDGRVRRIAAVKISGRMVGPVASGTVSARVRFVLGGDTVERCRSGTRAWQARVAAAEPTAGPPVANRGYFGLTSEPSRPHAFLLRVGARRARADRRVRVPAEVREPQRRDEQRHARWPDRGGRDVQPARALRAALRGRHRALPREGRRAVHRDRRQRHAVGELAVRAPSAARRAA